MILKGVLSSINDASFLMTRYSNTRARSSRNYCCLANTRLASLVSLTDFGTEVLDDEAVDGDLIASACWFLFGRPVASNEDAFLELEPFLLIGRFRRRLDR